MNNELTLLEILAVHIRCKDLKEKKCLQNILKFWQKLVQQKAYIPHETTPVKTPSQTNGPPESPASRTKK